MTGSTFIGNVVLAATVGVSGALAPIAAVVGGVIQTAALSALTKALSPKPKIADPGENVRFGPNPFGPRLYPMGRVGTSGVPVMATTHGSGKLNNAYLTYVVAYGGFGPIQGVVNLKMDKQEVVLSNSMVVSGQYSGLVWDARREGQWSQPWVPTFGGSTIPEWTADCRGSGVAYSALTYKYDAKAFTGGAPAPLWTLEGQRDVWNVTTGALGYSDYPADLFYTLLRGVQCPLASGARIGVGLSDDEIDKPQLAAWRAACVANNWRVSGIYRIDRENLTDVLRLILQAGGAEFRSDEGKASVDFFAPVSPAYTITETDLAGHPVERILTDRKSAVSCLVPRFMSEDNNWDMTEASEVADTSLTAQDGKKRTEPEDFKYVRLAQQARQLTAYKLQTVRQPLLELPVKMHACGIGTGTRVAVNLPEYDLTWARAVVVSNSATATTPGNLVVRLDPTAMHTWAMSFDGSTPSRGYMERDSASVVQLVDPIDWVATSNTVASPAGAKVPSIKITGSFPAPYLTRLDVQVKPNTTAQWAATHQTFQSPVEINPVSASTTYDIRARYVTSGGAASDWTALNAVTTGADAASTLAPQKPNLLVNAGPVENARGVNGEFMGLGYIGQNGWTVVQLTGVSLGIAAWEVSCEATPQLKDFVFPPFVARAGEVFSCEYVVGKVENWTGGSIGSAIRWFDTNDAFIEMQILADYDDGTPLADAPQYRLCQFLGTSPAPAGTAYGRFSFSSDGVGTGKAHFLRGKLNRGTSTSLWSDEATQGLLLGAVSGGTIVDENGNVIPREGLQNEFVPRFEGPTQAEVEADYLGRTLDGQLPWIFAAQFLSNGLDISGSVNWTLAIDGPLTATINAVGSITLLTANGIGSITRSTTFRGTPYSQTITVSRKEGARPPPPPPPPPPPATIVGAPSPVDTNANGATVTQEQSTGWQSITPAIAIRAGASPSLLKASFRGAYDTSRTGQDSSDLVNVKIRYRPLSGGTWTDIASIVNGVLPTPNPPSSGGATAWTILPAFGGFAGTPPPPPAFGEPPELGEPGQDPSSGWVELAWVLSGLTALIDYEFDVQGSLLDASNVAHVINFYGSFFVIERV